MRTSAVILAAGDGFAFQIREGYFRSGEQRDPAARDVARVGAARRRAATGPVRFGRPKIGSGKRTEPQTSGDGAGDGVIPLKCRPELPVVTRSGLGSVLPCATQTFCPAGKSPCCFAPLSSPPSKNFPLSPSGKTSLEASAVPCSQEGRFAIVTNVGAGCDGRVGIKRRMVPAADGEVVRS